MISHGGYQTNGQFQTTEEIKYAPVQDGELGNSKELPGGLPLCRC